ncbi:Glucokinase [Candidatus Rhabdochlamydia oedothoracis]|uniref:Glucokinase n=1 Tax=Candidatus Rhabdochlamydia oedothoracis TaxID=2720720 RepID=A0ABX8V0M4_9BACT|nr:MULTISPECIES: glucokinase [Rhabdochlamydia]KAG6559391.1 Glucokinase [Candidatus Rhabdochlamydia sp. W815]QYF48052.1 Glucokinase [Candidatus Rhabdochlamydia oedothoracis]
MLLAGDIGGTKVSLALFEEEAQLQCVEETTFHSRDFSNFSSLLHHFLAPFPDISISRAGFGIAGPVQDGVCRATNLPWTLSAKDLQHQCKIPHVFLLNDLEASGWGLQLLSPSKYVTLNEGKKITGNRVLISAGTGLGEAGLFWNTKIHHPIATEGGHTDFAPCNEEQLELFSYLYKQYKHVSYERVLSGFGLYQIYRFLVDTHKEQSDPEIEKISTKLEPQRLVIEKALEGLSTACIHAVEIFVSIYGAEAGNLALKYLARGGVYLGGGLAQRLLPFFKHGGFMAAFTAKGRFSSLMQEIPIHLILEDTTALLGAAYYASIKTL